MSETGAVRPCICGNQPDIVGPFPETPKAGVAIHCDKGTDEHLFTVTGSSLEEAVSRWNALMPPAARPLPDFPAGKSEDEGWISNAISKIPKRYILCPTCGEKNRIIVCVNLCGLPTAPARPAAAVVGERDPENYIHPLGYTVPAAAGLTDNEIRDCIYVGARAAGWQAEPVPSEVEFATAAIRHAALLSSRATGAEVEIPELTNDEIVALCKEAWGVSMPVSIHDISTSTVRLVRLAFARRHATIRGGGE